LSYTCISHLTPLISSDALTLGGSIRNLIARGNKSPLQPFSFSPASLKVGISAIVPCLKLYLVEVALWAE